MNSQLKEGKNIPDLLQETEEQEAEEGNDDSDVNTVANKIDKDNNGMIISMEKEQKTLEYQETMKVEVENISKNKKAIWRPIYEVIHAPFLKKHCFHQNFRPM